MTSSDKFKSNIKRIVKDINAYYQPATKSPYACLVIHEHLGLVENIVQVCKYLMGPKISLMVPDLFSTVTSKTLLNNQFDAVKRLKFSRVFEVIMACCAELKKTHKQVILMGFSVGSAYGLKILEKIGAEKHFQLAFLFYGVPDLKNFDPKAIKTRTILFHGTEDKIKYLSDPKMYEALVEKGADTRNIFKIEPIQGVGHGFMNPESTSFSEATIIKCSQLLNSYLPSQLVTKRDNFKMGEQGGGEANKKQEKKEDCRMF